MERILKYGDKIYVCRCKKVSSFKAVCIVEEKNLNKFSLINKWRGNKFIQDVYIYGYGRTYGNIFSESGLISRSLNNSNKEFSMLSNNKSHLKNRVRLEMKKKGIIVIDFVNF